MCDIWKVAGSSDQRDRGFQIPLVSGLSTIQVASTIQAA
jgi:hypothetical protein